MRKIVMLGVAVVGLLLGGATTWASTSSDIASANAAGHAVFLVVTDVRARGTERARQIADAAHALAPETAVVVLDRGLPENRQLVERYRLLAAPLPLILVIAPNGVVAGGALLRDATPQALVRTIPTPKKAEMLLHLSHKLPVFVIVSSEAMADQRSAVFEAVTQATQLLDRHAASVVVDLKDKAEKAWLAELKIAPDEKAPVTIVYNAAGQKTQVFRGVPTAAQLQAAATKKAACCPGGSC